MMCPSGSVKSGEHHEFSGSISNRAQTLRNIFLFVLALVDRFSWYLLLVKGGRCPVELVEFNMAQEYFKVAEGGVLVDVSCGSGLFSRKFAKSGVYSRVIALDFSENMLRQCYDFVKADESVLSSNLALVRADVSRLPFFSGSVDAVHAGAALHCWPSPSNAIAEINRILRSGGVFVGTTFLRVNPSTAPAILRALGQSALRTTYTFFTQEEIEDLVTTCGFVNYTSKVQGSFIMFSAQKR
ncbi:hypothetical protein CQW23_16463 [Capsicum baccatum]|uniref:Methyltransferase type 11 domain-containing protein n=1 Tax=Capsicum baccatum TaxID=33114 RepID=A0A2G2WB03_CAPBA|nr:hypothetical protein CQW23_16463 [Capsicum baccatum]